MFRLLKSSVYKLKRDITLRVTLIIGLALAVMLSFLNAALDGLNGSGLHMYCNGQTMLLSSFSTYQNFGLAIPINLAIFTTLEFSQGTIRNKVVVGNSKAKIYFSLLITGIIFTFILLLSYSALSTLLGMAFGRGFSPNYKGIIPNEGEDYSYIKDYVLSGQYIFRFIVCGILMYLTIATYSVFVATLTRNVGPSLPLIIVPLVLLSAIPLITSSLSSTYTSNLEWANQCYQEGNMELYEYAMSIAKTAEKIYKFDRVTQWINPLYISTKCGGIISDLFGDKNIISNFTFFGSITSNLVWSTLFAGLGVLSFTKRDLK